MANGAFPDLASNLIYTVLCLVPGFMTLKTVLYVGDGEFELDQFDKSTWSLIGSGLSLSVVYFMYVSWVAVVRGRFVLVVPIDLQWTELVAAYPLLLVVALAIGYLVGRLTVRIRTSPDAKVSAPGQERSTD